jgi:hypothetical protein
MQIASGIALLIEADEGAIANHSLDQAVVFLIRAIAPMNPDGARYPRHLIHPPLYRCALRHVLSLFAHTPTTVLLRSIL